MDDADLIARVYPAVVRGNEKHAPNSIKACSLYVPPQHETAEEEVQYGRDDRETTEPPEQPVDKMRFEYDGRPFIEVRFSNVPRSSNGVIFGCSTKSDVILPNLKDLSHFHFSLTFDEQKRLIVKDLGSLIGTEVTYDSKGEGTRRRFHWIIGGDKNAHRQKNIIIKVHDNVQFEVVANEHDIESQSYIENVEKFCQGSATTEGLFDDLNIPLRPDTEFATGAHTPGNGPIYVKRKIGKGGFGVAVHCWDVSTGDETVIKRPSNEMVKKFLKKSVDNVSELAQGRRRWKDEANNMRNLVHPHIIKLLDVVNDPYPKLVLEYISGGPLSQLENITISESVLVLTQCLSALTLMHKNQLAHRDISPNNILVKSREPFVVVLADFGLSKNAAELRTQCGTAPFAAPEVLEDSSVKRYSVAVDIWSLGVVICKTLRILPSYSIHMQNLQQNVTDLSWCNMVVDSLGKLYRRRPDSLKLFLLASMLVISPAGRNSARGCYDRVKALPDRIVNAEPCDRISDILWREATVVYPSGINTNEQSIVRLKDAAPATNAGDFNDDGESTDAMNSTGSSSGDDRAKRRSGAPPPSSHHLDARSNLKRPTAEMAPLSPKSKRQGRVSISQSHDFSGNHHIKPEVDWETAEVAALLQDLRNGAFQCDKCDNLPDPPSWHPWDPAEGKSMHLHWESGRGWVHCDHIVNEAAETNEHSINRSSLSGYPSGRRTENRTADEAQCGNSALSALVALDSNLGENAPICQLADYPGENDISAEPHTVLMNNDESGRLQKRQGRSESRSPVGISEIMNSNLWKEPAVSNNASPHCETPALNCLTGIRVGDLGCPIAIHSDTSSQQRPAELKNVDRTTQRERFQLVYYSMRRISMY
ncbi:hypothetical protein QQS21_007259 [Conoideocrella luteorostrata]|uniref:Kinase-like protein n=1 Tax=Conoideocrella luteorostrata TaxID=1105319 RepID=A0AAJ0FZL4_9HYPO|nr:hypothetical protein QQS21_007259 [Conoideocrella luteorostrata]